MLQALKQNYITNRAKWVHVLVVVATSAAGMWAENPAFRAKVITDFAKMPHWVQGLVGLAPFIWALYKNTSKQLEAGV
jgi:hypothetical protein